MNKTKERPTSQPITVNIDKLSAMLSCGHATARKIGEQAGAKIVIGRRVLYSIEKVKKYHLNIWKNNTLFSFMFLVIYGIIFIDITTS